MIRWYNMIISTLRQINGIVKIIRDEPLEGKRGKKENNNGMAGFWPGQYALQR